MVGHAGSLTGIVVADMTLTLSEVKVTGASKFPKIMIVIAGMPQEAVRAGGNDRQPPCVAFFDKVTNINKLAAFYGPRCNTGRGCLVSSQY